MPSGQVEPALTNGHDGHVHSAPVSGKKGKGKKAIDSSEASRLLQARISQLEQDAAGEKDQELEIEREVKRANRDLMQQVAKMDDMQKIEHLTKRSSELLADMRRLEKENQRNKKRGDTLQKERDSGRTELGKTVGLKEKLEKLCRELQRDNNKMKSFIEQYELRELHFHSLMRTKELEVQYHQSRYEREKKNAEAEASKARHLQAQVQAFTKTETELRNQLNTYVEKFKQGLKVEDTLNNSNDLFLSFRKEMEDMSKKGKRLEKENEALKRQKDATAANIIRMAEERQGWKKQVDSAEKKVNKLMSIIQQMQHQGRKGPPGLASVMENAYSENQGGAEGDDESDYSNEGEDEELSEFDDDTEEEPQPVQKQPAPVPYGPERPPAPTQQQATAATNGH
ncbi:Alpha-taxilin [Metarhizium anisopliae]|nr:Alpha-taxilin [Metarhizium anisopliae]